MKKSKIADLSAYVPTNVVTNHQLESRINARQDFLPAGSLERLFGSRIHSVRHVPKATTERTQKRRPVCTCSAWRQA